MTNTANPKTNSEAYELILAHFGKRHGAKTKLAAALGVTRQAVDRWQRHGIPAKYIQPISRLTKLRPIQIVPEVFR